MDIKEIFNLMKKGPSDADRKLISEALVFAQKAHEGQKRYSGEDYIVHPFEVAKILAEMGTDAETIAAGLLHDTVEDSSATTEDIEKKFGKDIAFMVDGVTKLGKLQYQGMKRHVESLRKLFVFTAKDIRTIMIRLADRLHNVRTLEHVPKKKQERIALETLEIYAPLANRLGMWRIKGSLEDAAFPFIYPEEYKEVVNLRKTETKVAIKRLEKIYRTLSRELAKEGLKDFKIDYRTKYLYSLYKKLKKKNMDIKEIYDISALRVVLDSIDECYKVLGVIHKLWKPVPGRLKDYIASPKSNGYQSIHTTIFTGDGGVAEIQIRTKEMHAAAEYGVASYAVYDEVGKLKNKFKNKKDPKINWINDLSEWNKQGADNEEFINQLKNNFFKKKIFVFTPKGDVVELPEGSTPIDFAYAIHSDIGDHASGALINNKFSSLDTELKDNDIVEVEVKKSHIPNPKWLSFVKTTGAKKHIKNFLLKKFVKENK